MIAKVENGLWAGNGSESVAIEAIERHPPCYANEIHDRGSSPEPDLGILPDIGERADLLQELGFFR
jgi:hypothetical protein